MFGYGRRCTDEGVALAATAVGTNRPAPLDRTRGDDVAAAITRLRSDDEALIALIAHAAGLVGAVEGLPKQVVMADIATKALADPAQRLRTALARVGLTYAISERR